MNTSGMRRKCKTIILQIFLHLKNTAYVSQTQSPKVRSIYLFKSIYISMLQAYKSITGRGKIRNDFSNKKSCIVSTPQYCRRGL